MHITNADKTKARFKMPTTMEMDVVYSLDRN